MNSVSFKSSTSKVEENLGANCMDSEHVIHLCG